MGCWLNVLQIQILQPSQRNRLNEFMKLSAPRILPKNILCLLILLALLGTSLLAGCQTNPAPTRRTGTTTPTRNQSQDGDQGEGTASPTKKAPLSPTRTPAAKSNLGIDPRELDGLQLQFWHAWTDDSAQAIDELVKDFNASNPWGIVVGASSLGNYDDLSGQTAAAIEQGTLPDLVSAYGYQAARWGKDGEVLGNTLVDLNTYIQDPEYGLDSEEQADFYPEFWEQDLVNDTRRGLPALRTGQVLYYNLSWAEELGFDSPPTTPEEFKEQACAAAKVKQSDDDPDNDLTGGWIISSEYPAVLGWLYAFGSPVVKPGGQGYQLGTSQVENAFRYLRLLYEERCAWMGEDISVEDEFAQRNGLFATGSLGDIPYQQAAFGRAGNRDRWTVIPFPSAYGQPAISVYGPSYILLKSTPERQLAAWLFARWMASPINQARLAEATSSLPLRRSTLDYLVNYRPRLSSQWRAGLDLLPYAHAEPADPSWYTVRWAVSDAATQLFKWYFTMKQLPATVRLLDRTAAELYRSSP